MKNILLLSVVVLLAVSSFANDYHHINTEPYWDGNITTGWLAEAQTFEAPTNTDMLVNWEFKLAGRTDPGQATFEVFAWGPTGPTGSALFSQTVDWSTQDQVYDITGIDLLLTPGQLYGAEIDTLGYGGQSVYFQGNETGYPGYDTWVYHPDFGGWSENPDTNQYFTADFAYVPESGTFVLFGSSLLGIAVRQRLYSLVPRKRRAAPTLP
jgi:hypothetical protein